MFFGNVGRVEKRMRDYFGYLVLVGLITIFTLGMFIIPKDKEITRLKAEIADLLEEPPVPKEQPLQKLYVNIAPDPNLEVLEEIRDLLKEKQNGN